MRDKAGMTALVVAMIGIWVAGFLWVRGDLTDADRASAPAREGAAALAPTDGPSPIKPATATPSVTSSATATPTGTPGATPTRDAARIAAIERGIAAQGAKQALRPRPVLLPPVAEFKVASFNILGSSHTKGDRPRASGVERMGGVLQLLAIHDISVVGIQEFQPDQRQAFLNRAGGWGVYPGLSMGRRAGENSVAWRRDTWELIETNLIDIPYFNGRQRPMPYVKLRHIATGIEAWFSTFHNPADVRQFQNQQRHRTEATNRQIGLFNRLEGTGVPQIVTGDMNERDEYTCRVTRSTPLKPAQGGGCPANGPVGIDWIFGSPKVEFSGYDSNRSDLVRRTSDHPLLVVTARIDALNYPKAITTALQ